jgi:arsenate reductase
MSDIVLWRRLAAEMLGSALLAAVVVGSGIAAQQLSPGNAGLELLENAAATAAGLFSIILMVGPISGGHLNPVVSFVDAAFGGLSWRAAAAYLPAQVAGCVVGAVVANLMFSKPAVSLSTRHRATAGHLLSEVVATLGLLLVIFALARTGRARNAPAAVGSYIGAAYFFTSSTSFANPAITVGRMFSNTFAGIAPSSAPTFIAGQVVGGLLAVGVIKVLYPGLTAGEAATVTFPHPDAYPDETAVGEAPSGTASVEPSGRTKGVPVRDRPVVVFVCVHNAGRSVAASVLLDHYAQGRIDVRSAGSEPAGELNPSVLEVLSERGLDASREFPKLLTDETARAADVVVTMGCGDACPLYPGKRYLDWDLVDPAGKSVEAVRPIVEDIDRRVRALLAELTGSSRR